MKEPNKAKNLKNLTRSVRLGTQLTMLAVCLFAAPAASIRAGDQVPFKGYFTPVVIGSTQLDDTHVRIEIDVSVQASQLGKAHGPAWAILQFEPPNGDGIVASYIGEATWAAANGDAITISFAGQFRLTETPGVLENVETFEIIGGTGRFTGATGGGVAGGLLDAETLAPLGKGAPFVGTVSSPGSLKK